MGAPLIWPVDSVTDTKVAVETISTLVLAANPARADAVFVNDSNQPIYLARGNTAVGYLNQGGGYVRELTARLSIANLINSYQVWANNKLALYQRELRRLVKARTYQEYPKS